MKRALFIALAISLFISCKEENTEGLKRTELNQSFSGQLNETILVVDTTQSFTVKVVSIVDERCSTHNTFCEEGGLCSVRIKLSNLDNSSSETILDIDNSEAHQKDSVVLSLDKTLYQINLNGVNPKPSNTTSSEPKSAEFYIKEL